MNIYKLVVYRSSWNPISLVLARLLVVGYGSIQEHTRVQCIPSSLVDVLEAVRAEEGSTEISSDYDEDVVDVLEDDEFVDPGTW